MLFLTAKLDKRKIIGGALALLVLAALAVLLLGGGGDRDETAGPAAAGTAARTNEQRVAYLGGLGWEVETDPIDTQTVTIPKDFSKVYADYNTLQKAQGFDLKKYAGLEATRYTYEVKNHPTAKGKVVADMIVYRGKVIAADVQSLSADGGFMEGVAFPKV